MAQPPGIVYSTTIPYSPLPSGLGYTPGVGVRLVVTNASGNTYIAGAVASDGLPATPGVVQPEYAGGLCLGTILYPSIPCPEVFIAKFDSKGMLLFLTYFGSGGGDSPQGLAVDAAGDIYIGGETTSTDFPLAGTPWRPTLSDEGGFLTKLSGDGKVLIWSTVLNGRLLQSALAPDGSVYYLAETIVSLPNGESITAALTKLTPDGQFVATVNVPPGSEALAVGSDGSVYIGGNTDGPGITATPGAWQTTYNGGYDGFVAKMTPSLSGFAWLTFVGGKEMNPPTYDTLYVIQPAADGTLWVSGTTSESDFPVLPGALQSQPSPNGGYLVHLAADGSKALAATYLPSALTSLALDGSGNVIFSAPGGFQATPGAQWPCQQLLPGQPIQTDVLNFFGKIDSAGQHLLWGTWNGPSVPFGPAAVGADGNAIAAGIINGQENITLSAMTTVPGPPRMVESCIAQSTYPNVAAGPLAPGEIFSIYGAGFGPQQGVAAQPSGNTIGTQLAGVQVFIENTPVPLLYVSSDQINLVAPYLLNGRVAAHIKIATADATSNEVVLGVRESAPEIFLNPAAPVLPVAPDGPTAAILNHDGTVNDQNHPAHIGDTVAMFVSGVGQTTPPGVDGEIPQAAGGTPVLPIRVQLAAPTNALPDAKVTYAGSAPGLVSGVAQVNFQIPPMSQGGVGQPSQAHIILYVGETATTPAIIPIAGPVIWFVQ